MALLFGVCFFSSIIISFYDSDNDLQYFASVVFAYKDFIQQKQEHRETPQHMFMNTRLV